MKRILTESLLSSRWELHLACGHVRIFHDYEGRGAPLGTTMCSVCRHREPITRRFKDGHETC